MINTQNNDTNNVLTKVCTMTESCYTDNEAISVNSYKSVLMFLAQVGDVGKPNVTLDDNGIFHMSWRKSKDNKTIIAFTDFDTVNYLIFKRDKCLVNTSGNIVDFLLTAWEQI